MNDTNKVLCNIAQTLTPQTRYQARDNIDTVTVYDVKAISTSHTVTQQEAQNGEFSINVLIRTPGLYLISPCLYISPNGTRPNENVVPFRVNVRRNYSDSSHNSVFGYTADLTRLDQNGPWWGRFDLFLNVVQSTITSLDFFFQFEPYKIPQNTPIDVSFSMNIIGNIDPSSL